MKSAKFTGLVLFGLSLDLLSVLGCSAVSLFIPAGGLVLAAVMAFVAGYVHSLLIRSVRDVGSTALWYSLSVLIIPLVIAAGWNVTSLFMRNDPIIDGMDQKGFIGVLSLDFFMTILISSVFCLIFDRAKVKNRHGSSRELEGKR